MNMYPTIVPREPCPSCGYCPTCGQRSNSPYEITYFSPQYFGTIGIAPQPTTSDLTAQSGHITAENKNEG